MRKVVGIILSLSLAAAACGDKVKGTTTEEDTVMADIGDASDAAQGPCAGEPDGADCDDGDPCTLEDKCAAGSCVGAVNDPCESEDSCMAGTCIKGEGCRYDAVDDGTTCSIACFGEATCISGKCEVNAESKIECPEPGDGQPCVAELLCDPATGQCTKEVLAPQGTSCDSDSNLCTYETCDAEGTCENTGKINECTTEKSDEPCQLWACSKKTGECQTNGFAGEISCDDGNACTSNDTCNQDEFKFVSCIGNPISVDDNNPCTNDSCVDGQVLHTPIDGLACDPEDPCSPDGLCNAGTCEPKTQCECKLDTDCPQPENKCLGVAFCDTSTDKPFCAIKPETVITCGVAEKACHITKCVPETGQCIEKPVADGADCDDGSVCSANDSCQLGI